MLSNSSQVAQAFGLGSSYAVEQVAGGLSNELWKLEADAGTFAVKVMRANADRADFRGNIEAAYAVEAAAFERGVPCPEPIQLPDGRCLAEVDGDLVRVHRWCDGRPPEPLDHLEHAGALLAQIHGAGRTFNQPLDDEPWDVDRWAALAHHASMPGDLADRLWRAAPDLAALEAATAAPGLVTAHAMSHGDLDPKNTLVVGGTLVALDWDAAGAQPVIREAVSVALDWSTDAEGFRRVLASYCRATDTDVVGELWPFGGWVSSQGGWLVYNATARIDTDLGKVQAGQACERLLALHASLNSYRSSLT
ncbi:phosphotransferase [Angustibacter luteus]|uniref:Phosphotransferase n=1 Tax=Angustibacter luteus TaxID=658456 RepID=A0ABW1JIT4_9ACTN